MAEVVLDANILVGWLDEGDALHNRVIGILERLERAGHEVVLTDVLLAEAISVLLSILKKVEVPCQHRLIMT